MIIYFSGDGMARGNPEVCLKEQANLMLSYHPIVNNTRQTKRFASIRKARKKGSRR